MQIDILEPQLYRADPYPTYAWLRKHAPVYWDESQKLWVVSKYEDVVYVSKNPKLFCSGFGVRPNLGGAAGSVKLSIIDLDEPRHGQLRRLVNRGFTPGRVHQLERKIRSMITQSIDAVVVRGACDFVKDIAVPLPVLVIADLMGIRTEDHRRFHQWSDAMIGSDGFYDDPEVMQKAGAAFAELAALLTSIIEERRKQPRDDLVSILLGRHHGFRPDEDTALGIFNVQEAIQIIELLGLGLRIFLTSASLITLLVGAVGVMNIMLVVVTERIKEIGLRKAIGASSGAIFVEFLAETLAITLGAGGVGAVLGWIAVQVGIAAALQSGNVMIPVPALLPGTFALILASIIGVGLGAGMLPAVRAARVEPAISLRAI